MKFRSPLINTVLFLILATGFFCCKSPVNKQAEPVVFYYPEKNVYYDSLQSNYYYSLNGGRSWDSMQFKGPGYGAVLGPAILLDRNTDSIWAHNEEHRKQFTGKLINLVNNKTIALQRADSVNKIKPVIIVKTLPAPEVVTEEPPKKGLKKFFTKLFGKKKKPKEEQ